ncbi:MAG: ABC transporter ATP-binding protein [Desulfobacteraceae bacterium]|jgi:ABC-type sugar transport system ATPase subunit|nr:ABC transporter ATP-binding protein [Desulfobacteraceae bacterium]
MPEVRLIDLHKEYPGVIAVKNVSITFTTATVTCLLGPSGCGKTTMMRIIAGLETPTAGDVFFDDDRITELPTRKRRIGMVFQYPVVYRGISVYRNIELPLLEEKLSAAERKKRIQQVIDILGLEDSVDKEISQLDGGTRQKVAIARTVARQPAVILFDEPITSVDAEAKVQLKRALKELTRQLRQTIIYVTHDQTEAMTLADQIALMKAGEIVQLDSPRTLYNLPNDVFGGWFLGNPGMNFFEYRVETLDSDSLLKSPLFPRDLKISGLNGQDRITIGIRPEHVTLACKPSDLAVAGNVRRKFIAVGGHYLVSVELGDKIIKVKVDPVLGRQIENEVWVECPLDWITLFGPDGRRLKAELSLV